MTPTEHGTDLAPTRSGVTVLVAMLFLVSVLNYLDRQIPIILLQSIKRDLALTDAQLGVLTGFAFAFVYSTLAFPLAVLADRWSAKWVLTICMAFWCGLTALSSMAQNFLQLAAARIGLAAGEAAGLPCSHSLIATQLPPERRGGAIAVMSLGMSVGGMMGLVLGGRLDDTLGWRMALLLVGAPGLLVALLFALVVPGRQLKNPAPPPVLAGASKLLGMATIRQMALGLAIQGVGQYAIYSFSAAFLIRSHGVSSTQAGLWLGLANGVAGIAALLVAGWLTDRFAKRSPHEVVRLPALAFLLITPAIVGAYLVPDFRVAVLLLGLINFGAVFYVPPVFATAQRLAPPTLRAQTSSVLVVGVSLVGGSVGPLLVGMVSDALTPSQGVHALRFALCLTAIPTLWGAFHLWLASRSVAADLAAAETAT